MKTIKLLLLTIPVGLYRYTRIQWLRLKIYLGKK